MARRASSLPLPRPRRAPQQLELGLERPHPHTEDDAPPAGDIERAVALDHLEGVVVAEHQDVRQEPDGLGHAATKLNVVRGSQYRPPRV